jgi:hypothetical protein
MMLCGIIDKPPVREGDVSSLSYMSPCVLKILIDRLSLEDRKKWLCDWVRHHATHLTLSHWVVLVTCREQREKNGELFPVDVALTYHETACHHISTISDAQFHRLVGDIAQIIKRSQVYGNSLERRILERIIEKEDTFAFVEGLYAGIFSVNWFANEMQVKEHLRAPMLTRLFEHDNLLLAISDDEKGERNVKKLLNNLFIQPTVERKLLTDIIHGLSLEKQIALCDAYERAISFVDITAFPEHVLYKMVYRNQDCIDVLDDSAWTDGLRKVAAMRWFEYLQKKRPLLAVEMDAALSVNETTRLERILQLIPHSYPDDVGVVIMRRCHDDGVHLRTLLSKEDKFCEVLAELIVKNNWVNHPEIGRIHFAQYPRQVSKISIANLVSVDTWDQLIQDSPSMIDQHPSYPDINEHCFDVALSKMQAPKIVAAHPKVRGKHKAPEAYDDWVYYFITEYNVDVTKYDTDFAFSERTLLALVEMSDHKNATFVRCQTSALVEKVYRPGMIINKDVAVNHVKFSIPFRFYVDAMSDEMDEMVAVSNRRRLKHLKGELMIEAIKRKSSVITAVDEIDADIAVKAMPYAKTDAQKRKLLRCTIC